MPVILFTVRTCERSNSNGKSCWLVQITHAHTRQALLLPNRGRRKGEGRGGTEHLHILLPACGVERSFSDVFEVAPEQHAGEKGALHFYGCNVIYEIRCTVDIKSYSRRICSYLFFLLVMQLYLMSEQLLQITDLFGLGGGSMVLVMNMVTTVTLIVTGSGMISAGAVAVGETYLRAVSIKVHTCRWGLAGVKQEG